MKTQSDYGSSRKKRDDVSYAQIERAALEILITGTRPTVKGVRAALKGGSPLTILEGLQRFWGDLGNRLAGYPDPRRRLPAAIAELADGVWQTALAMAIDAAQGSDAAMQAQLAALRTETETRSHALSLREMELDQLLRSRERTIKELEEHLRSTLSLANQRDATIGSLESRLAAALAETEDYRQRLAKVIQRAVAKNRTLAKPQLGRAATGKRTTKTRRNQRPKQHNRSKRVQTRAKR